MGRSSLSYPRPRAASSKKQVTLTGNDWPSTLDEEERRPSYQKGRSFCAAMERQHRHSRFETRK